MFSAVGKEFDKAKKRVYIGEIVEVTFYSYLEPLCGVFFKRVRGGYEKLLGEVPKNYYTWEIDAERYTEEDIKNMQKQ